MTAFTLTVLTTVPDYHAYQDIWTPTVIDQFDSESESEEERYTVSVYDNSDSSDVFGHLP